MQPIRVVLAAGAIFSRMRAWGRGALPINKMAVWHSWLSWNGYTQICVARGNVSWTSKDNDAAGELQLWYRERDNGYCLYASNSAGDWLTVCNVIDVFTLHFQRCTDKIKTLLTKKSKFHFVQYWKQIVPCESELIKGFRPGAHSKAHSNILQSHKDIIMWAFLIGRFLAG